MQEECNLMMCRSKSRAGESHVHTISKVFFLVFAIVSMYPLFSGFEKGYIFLCKIHLDKRETLQGGIVICVETTSSM